MPRYVAYGLAVASEIRLPELVAGGAGRAPDVTVCLGAVPAGLDGGLEAPAGAPWQVRPGAWLCSVPGVARFLVREGREVRIEPAGGSPADVRAFLFGSALGALLHQRRMFVLHACAVALPGGALAVAGPSGAGKSTTLAELARRGHPVLSDDKTVVRFGDEGPEVLPGYPTLRLREDALERIGEAPDGLPRVRTGTPKRLYRAPAFRAEPAPLRLVAVLRARPAGASDLEASDLEAQDALGALIRQTYRRRIVAGSGLRAEHFAWAARLAGAVPVVRVVRRPGASTVRALADLLEARLEKARRAG